MARGLQVFCLEGNWEKNDLTDRSSLEPLLHLLECHSEIEYIRRDVATKAEFDYYLRRWAKLDHDFGYLAFHGDRGKAVLLDDGSQISLANLGRRLKETKAAKDAVIFIASCYGLAVSPQSLQSIYSNSGASAVCGYTKEIDTIEAAAFEILLMHELYGAWRNACRPLKRFVKQYPTLVEELGFVYECGA